MPNSESGHEKDSFNIAIEGLRKRLLDISKRNPLTNTRLNSSSQKQVVIVEEISDQISRILYTEQKKFSFLPQQEDDEIENEGTSESDRIDRVYVPEELEHEVNAAHTDRKLQTELTPEALQKKLLTLFREARTFEEELGVNILYLALGFLRYYEAGSSDVERFAPLILLPVTLSRDSSRGMFKLSIRDDDLASNQSCVQMLKEEYDILLPDLPEIEGWNPSDYFKAVANAVGCKPRWKVEANRMVLRFFSFEKFMMSRDLERASLDDFESANGGSLKVVRQLLAADGATTVRASERGLSITETHVNLDKAYSNLRELAHILDADTSQTQVIAAVANGKRVLFVAEKRAALDVVHRRLVNCGIGHLCLELHSHKANRKHFYQDLKDTLHGSTIERMDPSLFEDAEATRDKLNDISDLVHTVDQTTGNTPYLLMGRMAVLSGNDVPPPSFSIDRIADWSKEEFEKRLNMVSSLVELVQSNGTCSCLVWSDQTLNYAGSAPLAVVAERSRGSNEESH